MSTVMCIKRPSPSSEKHKHAGRYGKDVWAQQGMLIPKSGKPPKAKIQATRARPADWVVASGLAWISAAVRAGRHPRTCSQLRDKGMGVLVGSVCCPDHTDTS